MTLAIVCVVYWPELRAARPNEIGDFLAGFFAPLAFFWFVTTVLLQRHELQLNREEMKLTRMELARQSAAMESTLAIDREDRARRQIENAIADIPRRMSPIVDWLRYAVPVRSGVTGEALPDEARKVFSTWDAEQVEDWNTKTVLNAFSDALKIWNRDCRKANGIFVDTLEDPYRRAGELQWELFRRWWADQNTTAKLIDDTSLGEAAKHNDVDLLLSVMSNVFEGKWVLVEPDK